MDDLNRLMNVVHNIRIGKTVTGTVKASWMKLTFEEDQIDFKQFSKIHTNFPRLFEPAFRLQQQMMVKTMGELWWTLKKRGIQNAKDDEALKIKKLAEKKEKRKQQKKNKKIQRNMGLLKYYLCPCLRKYYDPASSEMDKLTAEQKLEREQQLKLARRLAELKIKNPETADWLKYQKKVQDELGIIEEDREFEIKGKTEMKINEGKDQHEKKERRSSRDSLGNKDEMALVKVDVSSRRGSDQSDMFADDDDDTVQNKLSYMDVKYISSTRPREERALSRAERRNDRKRELHGK